MSKVYMVFKQTQFGGEKYYTTTVQQINIKQKLALSFINLQISSYYYLNKYMLFDN